MATNLFAAADSCTVQRGFHAKHMWCAGAVPMLIEIVKEGTSAVQSAVVALEKLCSHSSGWSQYLEHNQLHTPNNQHVWQTAI